jgi:NADPH-dependent 2,4-dienoyl-CoA reductase/sulfur reductase-like enzyme
MRIAGRGLIDRDKPVSFTFDGRRYDGFAGDTVASAMLANGQRLMGRSFKYHRPRGVLSAGSEEPNALVTTGVGPASEPNVRATMQEIYEGLAVRSQNAWPSLDCDLMAVNALSGGGVLLQDLHVAAPVLATCLRAGDPPCCGAWSAERSTQCRRL